LGVSTATALEVTSPEFKLVVVELARALPALLFPARKLRRGLAELVSSSSETMVGRRRRSTTVPCAPPPLLPLVRPRLGIGRVLGTYQCGSLRLSHW
jgi:hypothetical protein